MDIFLRLGLALAIGLLIGLERGWVKRALPEGGRLAGIRTFGLVGLLGGLWALLGQQLGPMLMGVAFVSLAIVLIVGHIQDVRQDRDIGITTVVAALVTFALGALAVQGYPAVAAAGAVVTTALLSLKPLLHTWLRRLEPVQLFAGIKLLLISVVVLPVLPNRGFGPWQALNPWEIWWMVVLIAGISFAGYVAMKTVGARKGILLTGLFGGLVSSTVTTINLCRLAPNTHLPNAIAAGVVLAAATMFPRMLLEVAVVNLDLLPRLALPLLAMTAAAGIAALWIGRHRRDDRETELPLQNPFELLPALKFGLFLAAIMLLAEALRLWLGDEGLYLLAAASGLADVDAITLSLSRVARGEVDRNVIVGAILLAAMVNTLVKGGLAVAIGGRTIAWRVVPAFALTLAASGLTLYLA